MEDHPKINRLELVDHRKCKACGGEGWFNPEGQKPKECPACHGMGSQGRTVLFWDDFTTLQTSVQDDGRTLKLFIADKE